MSCRTYQSEAIRDSTPGCLHRVTPSAASRVQTCRRACDAWRPARNRRSASLLAWRPRRSRGTVADVGGRSCSPGMAIVQSCRRWMPRSCDRTCMAWSAGRFVPASSVCSGTGTHTARSWHTRGTRQTKGLRCVNPHVAARLLTQCRKLQHPRISRTSSTAPVPFQDQRPICHRMLSVTQDQRHDMRN